MINSLKNGLFEGFWWQSYVMSKIDINMCEPHYVNLFFLWTSSIVYVFHFLTFDIFLTIWHLFDNLTSFWPFFNLNHLSPSQGYFWTHWKVAEILEHWIFRIFDPKICMKVPIYLTRFNGNSKKFHVDCSPSYGHLSNWSLWGRNISCLFVAWRVNQFLCNVIWEL